MKIFAAAEPINFHRNPLSSTEKVVFGGIIAAAIVGGVLYYQKTHGLSPNQSVTLADGAQTTRVPIGGKLTISLPSGADWSMGNVVGGLGNASVTVPVLGPGTYDLSWTSSDGQTHTTNLTVANS